MNPGTLASSDNSYSPILPSSSVSAVKWSESKSNIASALVTLSLCFTATSISGQLVSLYVNITSPSSSRLSLISYSRFELLVNSFVVVLITVSSHLSNTSTVKGISS